MRESAWTRIFRAHALSGGIDRQRALDYPRPSFRDLRFLRGNGVLPVVSDSQALGALIGIASG